MWRANREKYVFWRENIYGFKKSKEKKIKSFWRESFALLKVAEKKFLKKKTKSFGAFEWCLVLSEKYTKSFGGKIVLWKKGLHFWTVSGFEWKIY